MEVYLNNAKQKQRIQNVYIYNGIKPEIIESIPGGNVLAISGILGFAGETITLEPDQPFGELHLEIIENRIITEKGVEVKTSQPIVVYRETITKTSPEVEGKSPNKHNKLYFKVEPLEPEIAQGIKDGKIQAGRHKKKDDQAVAFLREECGWDAKTAGMIKEVYEGNIFMDQTRGIVNINEILELVLDMFED